MSDGAAARRQIRAEPVASPADPPDPAAASWQTCWSCQGPRPAAAPFCPTCNAVQPPGNLDHFRRFGLLPDFDLKAAILEKAYLGFQRALHPDRFAKKSPRERAVSQQQATTMNEAYETLKDPLRRATYLLSLHGLDADGGDGKTPEDPSLLMEALERHEALAEAQSVADVETVAARTRADSDHCLSALSQAFREERYPDARTQTLRLRYLRKLEHEARVRKSRLTRAAI